jgi:hypothetical protein
MTVGHSVREMRKADTSVAYLSDRFAFGNIGSLQCHLLIQSWVVQWLRCSLVTRETRVRFPAREHSFLPFWQASHGHPALFPMLSTGSGLYLDRT